MNRLPATILFALLPGMGIAADRTEAGVVDSGPVLKILRAEIAARPSRALIAVEDALTMNEQAACEIVQETIRSTRADAKLVGEIVFTALRSSPAMAATIVECAVRASPEAVEAIRAAVQRALGERAQVTPDPTEKSSRTPEPPGGSNLAASGKEPETKSRADAATAPVESEDSFLPGTIGVGGIYLLTPAGAWPRFCGPADPCCTVDLTASCLRP